MVKMIMELVRNRSFTLTTGDSKQSRLRRLKNGVPQRSVLVSLLFNIYTYDLPSMISRKFAYGDDLALLRLTPTDHLPVLSGIQPTELRQMGATLSLAYRGSLDPDHILYGHLSGSSDTGQVRLRSRRSFVPGARNLLDNLARFGIRASEWTNHKWKTKYCENVSRLRVFAPETGARLAGMGLP